MVGAPFLALASNIFFHVLLCRMVPSGTLVRHLATAFAAGVFVVIAVSTGAVQSMCADKLDGIGLMVLNVLTYTGLAFGYLNLVNLNVTSLRIRLIRELFDRHPAGISREEIAEIYSAREIVKRRLERLRRSGDLVLEDDRYHIGRRNVLLIARVFDVLAFLVRGAP